MSRLVIEGAVRHPMAYAPIRYPSHSLGSCEQASNLEPRKESSSMAAGDVGVAKSRMPRAPARNGRLLRPPSGRGTGRDVFRRYEFELAFHRAGR
jgi:hypothetical protein